MSAAPGRAYVDFGGLATSPAPFDCSDVTLWGLFVRGDAARLEALCERVFTVPSGGRVTARPISDHVLLTFGSAGRVVSRCARFSRMGWVSERQTVVWVPVHVLERRAGATAERIAWFTPYIWVDNPLSLSGGRELYGYPKNWGWIGLPAGGDPRPRFTLDAFGGDYDTGQRAARHRLVEISAGRGSRGRAAAAEPGWDRLGAAVDRLRRGVEGAAGPLLHPSRLPGALLDRLVARAELDQIMLRQFRAPGGGGDASEQQIVVAPLRVTHLRGRPLATDLRLTVHHLDSHPLGEELGLAGQAVGFAFQVEMSFVLEAGEVIWRTGSPGPAAPLRPSPWRWLESRAAGAAWRAVGMGARVAGLAAHLARPAFAAAAGGATARRGRRHAAAPPVDRR